MQPIKWHGGKHYLAPWIISHFPPHVHYVEPYFGGGAVLFAKPAEWIEGYSEVVNDLHGDLINFWEVLRSDGWWETFKRKAEATPLSEDAWVMSELEGYDYEPVRALAFFVRYRQSRQGLGKDFATLSRNRTRRGMNEQVSAWLSAVEGLPEAHERLKRVVILNRPAIEVIRSQDGPNTFFYLDPPYLHSTRSSNNPSDYVHEMSDGDHTTLLLELKKIRGKFLLSGYDNDLYEDFRLSQGWTRHEKEIDNKASSSKTKPKKVECIWANY